MQIDVKTYSETNMHVSHLCVLLIFTIMAQAGVVLPETLPWSPNPLTIKFNDSNSKKKLIFFYRSSLHMWSVELLSGTSTAVRRHYWDTEFGQWIQLIIGGAAASIYSGHMHKPSAWLIQCFTSIDNIWQWRFTLMVQSCFFFPIVIKNKCWRGSWKNLLLGSESQPLPSVFWHLYNFPSLRPESVCVPHWYCIWHLSSGTSRA